MKTFIKILLFLAVSLVLIQFIPVDKTNLPVDENINFISVEKTPEKIATLIKNACYDCHSHETKYPAYASWAPVSWSIKNHIIEGREHMNFSVWNTYNADLKKSMLKKSSENIESRAMPLPGYIVYHDEANLSAAERAILINYFKEMLEKQK